MLFKYCAIFLLFLGFAFGSTTEQRLDKLLPQFEVYIQQTMPAWAIPGMAVVIVTPGKVLFCKGFGTRVVGKNKPVDKHTIFQIASLTKNFTAALAGILEQKQIFSLHDLVKKYLPEFDLANHEIADKATLQDLISHRIGLDNFAGDSLMKFGLSPKEIIAKLRLIPLQHRFRENYSYSNQMFGLMGLVMESATNKNYGELLQEYILSPLNMTRSSSGNVLISQENSLWNKVKQFFGKEENIALCHDRDLKGEAVCIGLDPLIYVFPSTSGVNTTAHDFGIWLQCQLNNGKHGDAQVVPEAHIIAMRQALVYHKKIKPRDMQFPPERMQNVAYGMGWFMYNYGIDSNTIKVFEHMGGYSGQRSFTFMCPEQGFAVAILTNLGHFNINLYPEALRNVFLDLFLQLAQRNWSDEYLAQKKEYLQKTTTQRSNRKLMDPSPKKPDSFYIGTYANNLYGEIQIQASGKGLLLKIRDKSCHIVHWNGDEFSLNGWEFNGNMSRSDPHFIEFGTDDKGRTIAYLSFLHEGNDPIFVRKG